MKPVSCSIDFETRSVLDVSDVGVFVYAEHPTTRVLCASYRFGDGPVRRWKMGGLCPRDILAHALAGRLFTAWNAQFEATIWEEILVPLGWVPLHPEQWVCSAAIAARADLPRSLEHAARVLGIADQKDKAGHDLMMKLCRPRAWENGEPLFYEPDDPDCADLFARLYDYCDKDVLAESGILAVLPAVGHPLERRIWLLDQEINRRGVRVDVPLIHAALEITRVATNEINAALAEMTGGAVTKVTQTARIKKHLATHELDVASLNKANLRELLANDALSEHVLQILQLRKDGAKASVAKLTKMLECMCADERIRGLLLYYGAGTGRWAGRLVQPQNFPRPLHRMTEDLYRLILEGQADVLDLLAPLMEIMASMLRGCFIPAEGHDLAAADFAAIEARVLAWLAGAEILLEQFSRGESPYPPMGFPIFGHDCPKEEKGGDPFKYQVCKNTVLGCGYQMGWERFQEQAWEQTGLRLTDELCQRAVSAYRDMHFQIPAYWKTINSVCRAVVKSGAETWTPVADGKVAFAMESGYLKMRLPSGRSLWYPSPKMSLRTAPWMDRETGKPAKVTCVTVAGVNPVTKRWSRQALYGGHLTENAVQAIARDLMAEAMLRVEDAGYPVILTVHDEIVTEPPEGHGSVEDFCNLMSAVPEWATGCPVAAEGWRGKRYRK